MNIEMKGIDKTFSSNRVLKDAGFLLRDGEVHALMDENGGHRIDMESVLWLDGDYGYSRSLNVGEGLCYILQYRQDTLSWWWHRREFRLVMPL